MKFLSTRALHPLAFLGLLLVTATAFPTTKVLEEDTTDDTTASKPIYTTPLKMEGLLRYILSEIMAIRTELCDNDENCMSNEDAFSINNLELPSLTVEDGCFQTGYNQENCLVKVTSGLLEYQIYLEYIQKEVKDDQKERVQNLQNNIRTLVKILKQEIKNPEEIVYPSPTANASLMKELEAENKWQKTTTMKFILQELESFLETTLRVIREEN